MINNSLFTELNKRFAPTISAYDMVGKLVDVETKDGYGYRGIVEDNVSPAGICVSNGTSVMVFPSVSYYETNRRGFIWLVHEGILYKVMYPPPHSQNIGVSEPLTKTRSTTLFIKLLRKLRLT
jgi:hypothetical protein